MSIGFKIKFDMATEPVSHLSNHLF